MIIREIKGYEHEVHIGDSVIKEVLKEELSNEAMGFVVRIEETANDLLDSMYTEDEVQREIMVFVEDLLFDMYHNIKEGNGKIDPLEYINEMYKRYKGDDEK